VFGLLVDIQLDTVRPGRVASLKWRGSGAPLPTSPDVYTQTHEHTHHQYFAVIKAIDIKHFCMLVATMLQYTRHLESPSISDTRQRLTRDFTFHLRDFDEICSQTKLMLVEDTRHILAVTVAMQDDL